MSQNHDNPKWAEERRRITERTAYWRVQLGLDKLGLDVSNTYAEAYDEEDHIVVARTRFNWEYRSGSVEWYMARTAALSDEDLDEAIIHEYVHCLNAAAEDNVPEKYRKLIEFGTESITQAILNVWRQFNEY